jgi:uncharacterized protein (TIGR03083 family)
MGAKTQDIIQRMQTRAEETVTYFGGLGPEAWTQQVYTTGPEWDVRQVLCHFVSAESSFEDIFAAALRGDTTAPDDFDIDEFNAREVGQMDDWTPDRLVEQFQTVRAGTIAFLQSIDDPDLERQSWHPWFGWDKLEKFLKLVYRHNMIHERDVRKALEMGVPVPPSD